MVSIVQSINVLGDELTLQLRKTGELRYDYVYIGERYGDEDGSTDDHVVPLKCVIERLVKISQGWPVGKDGIARFRKFMIEHLVMAEIPKTLNARLVLSAMPNDDWYRPVRPAFSEKKKRTAIWGRYNAKGICVTILNANNKSANFRVREKKTDRKTSVSKHSK